MAHSFPRKLLILAFAALAPVLVVTAAVAGSTGTPTTTPSPSPSPTASPSLSPTAAASITPTPLAASPAPPAYSGAAVASASAELKDATGKVVGSAHFTQNASGVVQVKATFGGVAGAHGMHVHTVGKCDAPDFTSAGGHFNPTAKKHGLLNPDGPHAGDLPEMTVPASGAGSLETTTNRFSLTAGATSVFDADGSAFVIHAGHDDQVTDPTGNSGARLACGVIVLATPASLPATGGSQDNGGSGWLLMAAMAAVAALAGAVVFGALKRSS